MRFVIAVAAMATLVGCIGTTSKMANLRVGISREEAVRIMGKPDRLSANADAEYLVYQLASPKQLIADENNLPEYVVKVRNGKVEAFGRIDEIR
jgi:hypothetical protein